jgi:hypothetical protein
VRSGAGWKLNSKALFDRARLRELQSSYAEALAPLGIRRGEPGSEAKHSEVKQFYGAVQAAKQMPERAPLPPAPKTPMPPAKLSLRVRDTLLGLLGIETEHERAMRVHRERLARWRAQVGEVKEQNERAWQTMRAAATVAPLARKQRPSNLPPPSPPHPVHQPRTSPRPR